MSLYRESEDCPASQSPDGNHSLILDTGCAYCGLMPIWPHLVPDDRLQDIADAWKAAASAPSGDYIVRVEYPALAALLDALTEEER